MNHCPPIDFTFWICLAFLVSEVTLSRVRRAQTMKQDGGSLRGLHWTIGPAITLGAVIACFGFGFYPLTATSRIVLSSGVLFLGGIIRWTAIAQLGKRFTVAVQVSEDHTLKTDGLYRFVRHPSYTGLAVQFIGLSFYFSNWISQLVILVPIAVALWYRIRVEEETLRMAFGEEYADYSRRTSRLFPGIW